MRIDWFEFEKSEEWRAAKGREEEMFLRYKAASRKLEAEQKKLWRDISSAREMSSLRDLPYPNNFIPIDWEKMSCLEIEMAFANRKLKRGSCAVGDYFEYKEPEGHITFWQVVYEDIFNSRFAQSIFWIAVEVTISEYQKAKNDKTEKITVGS